MSLYAAAWVMVSLAAFIALLAVSMLVWAVRMEIHDAKEQREIEKALASTGIRRVG